MTPMRMSTPTRFSSARRAPGSSAVLSSSWRYVTPVGRSSYRPSRAGIASSPAMRASRAVSCRCRRSFAVREVATGHCRAPSTLPSDQFVVRVGTFGTSWMVDMRVDFYRFCQSSSRSMYIEIFANCRALIAGPDPWTAVGARRYRHWCGPSSDTWPLVHAGGFRHSWGITGPLLRRGDRATERRANHRTLLVVERWCLVGQLLQVGAGLLVEHLCSLLAVHRSPASSASRSCRRTYQRAAIFAPRISPRSNRVRTVTTWSRS